MKLIENENSEETEKPFIKVFAKRCSRQLESNVICHNCVQSCPKEAIDLRKTVKVLTDKCDGCAVCVEVCPANVFTFPDVEEEEKEKNKELSRREFFQRFRFKE